MPENDIPGGDAGKKAKERPVEKTESSEPKKLTPAAWAVELGLVKAPPARVASALKQANMPVGTALPQAQTVKHWSFAAADKLFGWSEHSYHHEQGEDSPKFVLTQDDFVRALKAAAEFPASDLSDAAIPESQRKRLEKYKRPAKEQNAAAS